MKVSIKEFPFDGDCENIFEHLYKDLPYSFWLDSSIIMEGLSRYSIMGANPKFSVCENEGSVEVIYPDRVENVSSDAFTILQSFLQQYSLSNKIACHLPFIGGFVGYFGYEMLKHIEEVPTKEHDLIQCPLARWLFYDQIIIIDNVENIAYLTCLYGEGDSRKEVEVNLEKKADRIREVSQKLSESALVSVDLPTKRKQSLFKSVETYESYIKKIKNIKTHIRNGDIYQACFTHRFHTEIASDPFQIYRVLRRINPAPFAAFLDLQDYCILSSSPERFIRMGLNQIVESRPIKGTRPRGKTEEIDAQYIKDLQSSEKDRAENVMIVDLVRNDLNRICENVLVEDLFKLESYATVHQLVSTVRGYYSGSEMMDILRATFPGGSMTGAPKVRAMEILGGLEPVSRGVYSGGLGYLDVRRSFDLSMVIRTIICTKKIATFHVGGGIVQDSIPEDEYMESMNKAAALMRAIEIAESSFSCLENRAKGNDISRFNSNVD